MAQMKEFCADLVVYCEKAFSRSQIQLLMIHRTLIWKYHEIQTPGDYSIPC